MAGIMTNAEIVRFIEPLFAAKYRIPGKDDRPNKIPYEFDCQTFVKYVMKHCFDRDIFMIATPSSEISVLIRFIKNHPERVNWPVVEKPEHGGIVEMSSGQHPHHVGLWLDIDGGAILHCYLGGVGFQKPRELEAAGWRRFIYHGWNASN
jgi:hypothetical protein